MVTKTLSDKIQTIGYMKQWIKDEGVKEFIKELKEEMFDLIYNDGEYSDFAEMIDKLSGPKLI
jgi:hypothetical protein